MASFSASVAVANRSPRQSSFTQIITFSSIVFGVLSLALIWPTVIYFRNLWISDPLQSIGVVIPLVSFCLILREWRRLGWRSEGTWWGVILLLATAVAVRIGDRAVLFFVVSPSWSIALPPPQIAVLGWASGVILLVGGTTLLRASLFPVLLLLLSSPVPHIFSKFIDLPLQHMSAWVARSFAIALGQPLTPDKLRIMFTPEFGMFIAPGCNGIRGAVTMGLIALVAGYLKRFRLQAHILFVAAAILLGYFFNLLRLCTLILYYFVALHLPWLQDKAENADYAIGAILFLFASILLFQTIGRFGNGLSHPLQAANPASEPASSMRIFSAGSRVLCLGLIAVAACITVHPRTAEATFSAPVFPSHSGGYDLVRTWDETMETGTVVYHWARYTAQDGSLPIDFGVAPSRVWHEPVGCHLARGLSPLWQGQLVSSTEEAPVNFSAAFYADGITQSFEAATLCTRASCGLNRPEGVHTGLVYSHPDRDVLLSSNANASLPVLLRVETADVAMPSDQARRILTNSLQRFLTALPLASVARGSR